jgi:hypothetical protein
MAHEFADGAGQIKPPNAQYTVFIIDFREI